MAGVPVRVTGVDSISGNAVDITGVMGNPGLVIGGGPIIPPGSGGEHPAHPIHPGGPVVSPPIYYPPVYPGHPIAPGGERPEQPIYMPGPHPEHPIVIPQPPTEPPQPPTEGKPPPADGGWGWHPVYGWGYFPGGGGKPNPGGPPHVEPHK